MHNETGIGPGNLLLPKRRLLRLGRVRPMLLGSAPSSWFSENEMVWRDDILKREEGIVPGGLLTEIEKKHKPFRLPMPFEIFPTNLSDRDKILSEERFTF